MARMLNNYTAAIQLAGENVVGLRSAINHRNGRNTDMADDRMKNDDLQRNMGTSGKEGQDYGQQTPGRQGGGQQSGGQHVGGQKGGQQGQGGYGGSQQNEPRNMEDDDEFGGGSMGQSGGQGRGGQNR